MTVTSQGKKSRWAYIARLNLTLFQKFMLGEILTVAVDNPFYFGIEWEYWEASLPGLIVPIHPEAPRVPDNMPGTTNIIILKNGTGYSIVTLSDWIEEKDLLMAVALVLKLKEEMSKPSSNGTDQSDGN